jgi:hypothetical protein
VAPGRGPDGRRIDRARLAPAGLAEGAISPCHCYQILDVIRERGSVTERMGVVNGRGGAERLG